MQKGIYKNSTRAIIRTPRNAIKCVLLNIQLPLLFYDDDYSLGVSSREYNKEVADWKLRKRELFSDFAYFILFVTLKEQSSPFENS